MMNNDIRWRQRFQNFERAFTVFQRRVDECNQFNEEVYQMALIQAFEVVQELSWKVLKDYLENEGYDKVSNSRQVFRTAFQEELITEDAEIWMNSIKNRNLTSHTYDEDTADEILKFILNDFYPVVRNLYHKLKKEI